MNGLYEVKLITAGAAKLQVIKEVKRLLGISLGESRSFVDSAPCILISGISYDKAIEVRENMEQAGATVTVTMVAGAAAPQAPQIPQAPQMPQAPVAPAASPTPTPEAKAELNALLKQYLSDGIISDKERAVLLRKAAAIGIDQDEYDLYIDAEVQKYDEKLESAKRKEMGKLCPFCETQIPMMASTCPECGKAVTPEATKELEEILNALEDALVDFKSGRNVERSKAYVEKYIRRAKMYYGENNKIKIVLAEVVNEMQEYERRTKREKAVVATGNIGKKVVKVILRLVGILILLPILLLILDELFWLF